MVVDVRVRDDEEDLVPVAVSVAKAVWVAVAVNVAEGDGEVVAAERHAGGKQTSLTGGRCRPRQNVRSTALHSVIRHGGQEKYCCALVHPHDRGGAPFGDEKTSLNISLHSF